MGHCRINIELPKYACYPVDFSSSSWPQSMRIYLQSLASDDKRPRFCHLFLQQDLLGGWTLVKEWGYQGASGRLRKHHYATQQAAEEALVQARDEQLRRGFRMVFAQGSRPSS